MLLRAFLLFCVLKLSLGLAPEDGAKEQVWWQHAIVYQIYPRSLQDTNDDGTGDLKGIESRLPYFADLGVQSLWLSPIYRSPMKDFGYDISDFKDVDPVFGTLDDFRSLVSVAHDLGIKIVMDFVPNHSSDEHAWFQKSVAKEEPYIDYYVWVDPKGFDDDGNPIPPSNWVSVFGKSMWEYREERGQFYLHQFLPGQPDLNYRNPLLVAEIMDVFRFWLDLGVDGFRMDAIVHLWEDDRWLDEPLSEQANTTGPDDYGHYKHIYTAYLPETRALVKDMNDVVKSYGDDKLMMLEAYLSREDMVVWYEVGDFPFNFAFMAFGQGVGADEVKANIDEMMAYLPEGKTANWLLGNHDKPRVGDRVEAHLINAFNLISLTLPGVAITYQGEEIGMTGNYDITFEEAVDPSGCLCGPDLYLLCSRDPERTPMQWNGDAPYSGFSGSKPWLPVNKNYVDVNVATETDDDVSALNVYKTMAEIRKTFQAFSTGQLKTISKNGVLGLGRLGDDTFSPTFVTLVNFNSFEVTVDIKGEFNPVLDTGLVAVGTGGPLQVGDFVDLYSVQLSPFESVVLEVVELK